MPAPRAARSSRPLPLLPLAAALFLSLAGCTYLDPYRREGMWNPTGANEANLGTMVATPTDLAKGQSDAGSSGDLAAAAVKRLRTDHVKSLPAVDTTGGTISGGGGGGGGGAPSAGGGGP